jgi:hypothetical protein
MANCYPFFAGQAANPIMISLHLHSPLLVICSPYFEAFISHLALGIMPNAQSHPVGCQRLILAQFYPLKT